MAVKKPTSPKIVRTGATTFKATWKKGQSYSAERVRWGVQKPKKKKISWTSWETVTGTAKSHTFSGTAEHVYFEVEGKSGGHWSGAARDGSPKIYPPKMPNMTTSVISYNQVKFAWTEKKDSKHDRPISHSEYQLVLKKDRNGKIKDLKGWGDKVEKSKDSNWSVPEDTSSMELGASYTRAIRVREVGLGGASEWRYGSYIFADPRAATNLTAVVTKDTKTNVLICDATWNVTKNGKYPIDTVVPEYGIDTPIEDLEPPDGISWNQLPEMTASESGKMQKRFVIDTTIPEDKCLFFRVEVFHSGVGVPCLPILASGDACGSLKAPTFGDTPVITSTTVKIWADNESSVGDSFVVAYMETSDGIVHVLGRHDNGNPKTYTVEATSNIRLGLKAFVGDWDEDALEVEDPPVMQSDYTWSEGSVPIPPSSANFKLEQSNVPNTLLVSWDEDIDADGVEISWSTEPDAWYSNEEPETYIMYKDRGHMFAIKGVEAGVATYVKVRYVKGYDDDALYSDYSESQSLTLTSVPLVPELVIEEDTYNVGEDIPVSWVYITDDGTQQARAEVAQHYNGQYINRVAVEDEQNLMLPNIWAAGTQIALAVHTASVSSDWSEWSGDVVINIVDPLTCGITDLNVDANDELHSLPIVVSTTGGGDDNDTTIIVRRATAYKPERPDGDEYGGFQDEVVFEDTIDGDADDYEIDDKVFDDGGSYIISASVEDEEGRRSDTDERTFTVNWDNKPIEPAGTVTIDTTNNVAIIAVGSPSGAPTGATVDIYRRSLDGNELIYEDATLGQSYVDPYPSIGNWGYMLVMKNAYGGYFRGDSGYEGVMAYKNIAAQFDCKSMLIDFDDEQVALQYNLDLSDAWDKDYKDVKYLGGTTVGYYIEGVQQTGSVGAVVIPIVEIGVVEAMRRLASRQKDCHVRKPDGSSFTAAVQVTEDNSHDKGGMVISFNMSITRTTPTGLDGMSYTDWSA